jgi:hypothetical protein
VIDPRDFRDHTFSSVIGLSSSETYRLIRRAQASFSRVRGLSGSSEISSSSCSNARQVIFQVSMNGEGSDADEMDFRRF